MAEPEPGIYEAVVTEGLKDRLELLESRSRDAQPLRSAEAADRIALHLGRQIEQSLAAIGDKERVQIGIEVARPRTAAESPRR